MPGPEEVPLGIPWADIMPYHTLVFSDSFNVSGSIGWETWNLTTPFSYNGDALEIAGEYVLVASAVPAIEWEETVDAVTNPVSRIAFRALQSGFPLLLDNGGRRRPNIRITYTACPLPQLPIISNITSNSADISWPSVSGAVGYEWAVTTSATPPASGTGVTDTFSHAQNLTATTAYYAHIRTNCGTSFSGWRTISLTTTGCPPPLAAMIRTSGSDADFKWPSVIGATGYQYMLTTNPVPPVAGTPTTADSFHASGLTGVTTYYVHVRTDCGTGGFSFWTTTAFNTSCFKPSPFVVSVNPRTGTAEIRWNKVSGAIEYEYAILPRAAPPVDFSAARTFDTVAYFTGLSPGLKYWFHIRTHCRQTVFSDWASIEFHPSGIEVYPNPASGRVTIKVYGIPASDETILVTDAIGRIMRKLKLTANMVELDMTGFAAGLYLVKYENYGGYVTKIVKQ